MESRGTKVNRRVKEIYFIRAYFRNTRPVYNVIHQNILVQGCNGSSVFAIRLFSGGKKARGTKKEGGTFEFDKSLEIMHLCPIYFISR